MQVHTDTLRDACRMTNDSFVRRYLGSYPTCGCICISNCSHDNKHKIHDKGTVYKIIKCYKKNYRQPRSAKNGRSSLLLGGTHKLLIQ